jgi:hypothetical protein
MLANQTTDNAPNELAAAKLVLESKGFYKTPASCIAHTLQLDLEPFFSSIEVSSILTPILKINIKLLNNFTLTSEFEKYQQKKLNGDKVLHPCRSVITRWWSQIPALSFYVRRHQIILSFFGLKLPNFFDDLSAKMGHPISPPSLEMATGLLKYLKKLEDYSELLSSEKCVTSTLVLTTVNNIRNLSPGFPNPTTFPRLSLIFKEISIWSKAAFFDPHGLTLLQSLGDTGLLLSATRQSILDDLNKIALPPRQDGQLVDCSNPFKKSGFQLCTLSVLESIISSTQNWDKINILELYSEDILPKLSQSSPQEGATLKALLSLIFSVPATQMGCERLFSKASATFDKKRNAMSSDTLQSIVTIQRVFPNTHSGIYSALNAIRQCDFSLLQESPSETYE